MDRVAQVRVSLGADFCEVGVKSAQVRGLWQSFERYLQLLCCLFQQQPGTFYPAGGFLNDWPTLCSKYAEHWANYWANRLPGCL